MHPFLAAFICTFTLISQYLKNHFDTAQNTLHIHCWMSHCFVLHIHHSHYHQQPLFQNKKMVVALLLRLYTAAATFFTELPVFSFTLSSSFFFFQFSLFLFFFLLFTFLSCSSFLALFPFQPKLLVIRC